MEKTPAQHPGTTTSTSISASQAAAPPTPAHGPDSEPLPPAVVPLAAGVQSRPCDICRQRKTRCVREGGRDKCFLCTSHGQPCTYLRGPLRRKRRKVTDSLDVPSPTTDDSVSTPVVALPSAPAPLNRQEGTITDPAPELLEALSPSCAGSEDIDSSNPPSLLDGTLGLHLKTHPEYVGNTSYREPSLLDLHSPNSPSVRSVRRLDESTVFLIHRDRDTSSESKRKADLDAIEKLVHPLGPTLVRLYFRIVHPSFPILHKKVFLEKYARSYHEFSPPLLAAVYLIALDWSLYDRTLASSSWQPDQTALEALALRTMSDELKRPKISTIQAGLLIQQRFRNNTWTFTAQLTALAEGLGLHVDCSEWAIPEWEKGLRRRLAWALFMQDKWGALIHGRPSHVHLDEDWDVRPCRIDDFPENAADEEHDPEGSAEVVVGRELFLRQIELSFILSDVLATFYTAKATRRGGTLDQLGTIGVVELAKPIVMALREWYARLPEALQLQETRLKKLSANGSLHLSYISVDLAVHRSLVRNISPTAPPELRAAIRTGARTRLAAASKIISNLQMEHIQSFWGFAASAQLASIGSFAGLLWATSDEDTEAKYYADCVEEYLWSLRVRAQAAPFAREALRMLEADVGGLGPVRAAASGLHGEMHSL
ncbi:fungal-specific transcription factor domain-containing protein [Phyllosticta capitalensis]